MVERWQLTLVDSQISCTTWDGNSEIDICWPGGAHVLYGIS